MAMGIGWRGLAIVAAIALGTGAGQAETLQINGNYAAAVDLPGDVQVIALDRFGGDFGEDVAVSIAAAMDDAVIGGEPYLALVSADHAAGGRSEAMLRGSVTSEVFERGAQPRIERECVERDAANTCVRREETVIPCRELSVQLSPRIALMDRAGGVLHAVNQPRIELVRFCEDDAVAPSALAIIDGMITDIAAEWRFALAPQARSNPVRIMERRKGLGRADRDAFRDAVRQTSTDPDGACRAFAALEEDNPQHVSVLFNIGLCREGAGDLAGARNYYARALIESPGRDYPSEGMARIVSRERAEVQLAVRGF